MNYQVNGQRSVGTLVERTTRTTILVPLKEKDAASVRRAYVKELRLLPNSLTKTLTYDQGKEMSQHQQFTVATDIPRYTLPIPVVPGSVAQMKTRTA